MSFGAGSLRGGGSARGTIDHRLARRALINEYRRGRLRRDQICDAHPELVRAANNVGEQTTVLCPICEDDQLVLVTYVFGPRLPAHGRCVSDKRTMNQLNRSQDDLSAYIVECCRKCSWHHLLRVLPVGGRKQSRTGNGTG